MLRVLLILWLAIATPLYSMGSGVAPADGDASTAVSITAVPSETASFDAVVTDAKKHCCEEAKLADSRSGPCKSDCKAVMGGLAMATGPSPAEPMGTDRENSAAYFDPVDLRPPIS